MIGIYLSGTGNTKHCIEYLLQMLDKNALAVPIESDNAVQLIQEHDFIILAYPTQYSNAPIMVRDFIKSNSAIWKNKNILCMATMGAFSGDGAACTARLLKKYGAKIAGGLHIHMPDSVCDVKLLKKSIEENRVIIKRADVKLRITADNIKKGKYPRDGLNIFCHIAGLFGQRLWFYGKTTKYSDRLKISDACTGCGTCAKICPMKNISMQNGKPYADNKCTMCYRCISLCPNKAITLTGDKIYDQYRFEKNL